MNQFILPDLGEGVHEGQVIRLHVKAGDQVREDDPLMEVETDKAAVEIPSPHTGTVSEVHCKEGQIVHVGDVMVTFDGEATKPAASSTAEQKPAVKNQAASRSKAAKANGSATATAAPPQSRRQKPASPAVRKLARERGLDINTIDGSGPGGRVTRSDVENATGKSLSGTAKAARSTSGHQTISIAPPQPLPTVDISGREDTDNWGPIVRQEATRARRTIADTMTQSWTQIPHVTDTDDADITLLDELRKGYNADADDASKLTTLPFVLRAVASALAQFPVFNAKYDADTGEIIYKRYISISIGVQTERGLIAPVIREADQKSIPQLADDIADLTSKARTASFAVNDTRGGTFTVSNAGAMGGSRYSTPIINPPQVAVLALGRAKWRPWVVDRELQPRLILPLSLSFDHRIIDGGVSVPFMQHIISLLQNPARLLM